MKSWSRAGANGERPCVEMLSAAFIWAKGRERRQFKEDGVPSVEEQEVLEMRVLYAIWGRVEL